VGSTAAISPKGSFAGVDERSWASVPHTFRSSDSLLPEPWQDIFGPLRQGKADDLTVVGQVGQSIDGRIATVNGDSHYINGPDGLAHLHRLRALADAVIVGIGTAVTDDPQLTVRRVVGPNPARVVIDPNDRLPQTARLLAADGVRRLVVGRADRRVKLPPGVEAIALPTIDGHIAPASILVALAERGFRRILVEGGANTVSRFLAAGCLDRLHVMIAPMIIGAGPSSAVLPPITQISEALRTPMRVHPLGDEVLLDCDLGAHRIPVAKTSA